MLKYLGTATAVQRQDLRHGSQAANHRLFDPRATYCGEGWRSCFGCVCVRQGLWHQEEAVQALEECFVEGEKRNVKRQESQDLKKVEVTVQRGFALQVKM